MQLLRCNLTVCPELKELMKQRKMFRLSLDSNQQCKTIRNSEQFKIRRFIRVGVEVMILGMWRILTDVLSVPLCWYAEYRVSSPRTSLWLYKRCGSADAFRCGILTTNRSSRRQGWYPHSCSLDGPHIRRTGISLTALTNCATDRTATSPPPCRQSLLRFRPTLVPHTLHGRYTNVWYQTGDRRDNMWYLYSGRVLVGWRLPWLGKFVVLVRPCQKMPDKTAS